jgi:N-acyl-L-homoserine lactone synthetase
MGQVATFPNGRSTFSQDASSQEANSGASFSDRVAQLLDRVDYRLAITSEQREAIFRLRYQAYVRDGGIHPNPSQSFSDHYDDMGNVFLFGVYIGDDLAGSIRVHLVTSENPHSPSVDAFSDFLQPELDAGKVLIDSTRFVSDETLSRIHRTLPYAISRLSGMAAHHFNADHLLAAVRVEHQAFYRRIFNHQLVCEPRPYPGLARPLSLMTVHYPTFVDQVHRRFPFFRSTFFERRMLFESGRSPSIHQPADLLAGLAPGTEHDVADTRSAPDTHLAPACP